MPYPVLCRKNQKADNNISSPKVHKTFDNKMNDWFNFTDLQSFEIIVHLETDASMISTVAVWKHID